MVQYRFKQHSLSDAERIWLTEAANTRPFDVKVAKVRLFGKIPVDFDPLSIDQRLYVPGALTPLGMWHIDPNDKQLIAIDKAIAAIRETILSRPGVEDIHAFEIAAKTKLSEEEIERAFRSFSYLGAFYSRATAGKDPERYSSIGLAGDTAYDEYLRYKGLDELLERRYLAAETAPISSELSNIGTFWRRSQGDHLFDAMPPNIERKTVRTNTAFVIMAIDPSNPELEDVYNTIKDVFREFDIHARRADEIEHQDKITDIILKEIRECEFLFADLSLERPNVYYEIGYAHAVNKRPILFRKSGTKLHFDLSIHNAPEYRNISDLRTQLTRRLEVLVGRAAKET